MMTGFRKYLVLEMVRDYDFQILSAMGEIMPEDPNFVNNSSYTIINEIVNKYTTNELSFDIDIWDKDLGFGIEEYGIEDKEHGEISRFYIRSLIDDPRDARLINLAIETIEKIFDECEVFMIPKG